VPCIAVNEFFTMTLAKLSGLNVPEVDFRRYGETPTLVVDRFDRHFDAEHQRVRRRHVIDGCQAVNLPPSYKYERQFGDTGDGIYIRDGVSFPKLFSVRTNNALAYHTELVKWMTFNLLNANYDAHGKNISYFVGKNGLELAPFYDLVNVEASIQDIREKRRAGAIPTEIPQVFAMSIGDYETGSSGNFDKPITSYMLADFAKTVGLPVTRLQLLMQQTLKSVLGSLTKTKEQVFQCSISDVEKGHVELCIRIVENEAKWLQESISELPGMEKYV
ncbi:MAG: HipA domain-containing protein, partial [Pseudomonadota bacterium]